MNPSLDHPMNLLTNPAGRNVVVVGGGRTGASAARLLVRLGARVTVADDAPAARVTAGLARFGVDPSSLGRDIAVRAGGLDGGSLTSADLIVLSPGVPRGHGAVQAAIRTGVPIVNEIELAAAHLPAGVKVLAITGTNGKSTTTTMAGAIARVFDPSAFVGGNLGTPYCDAVLDGPTPTIAVLELSSYQLETLGSSGTGHLRVRAAVVTNLTPDHLDRYPSAEAYYAAKARLLRLVEDGGGVSLNESDAETRRHLFPALAGSTAALCHFDVSPAGADGIEIRDDRLLVRLGSEAHTLVLSNPHIVGRHNRQNAAAAVAGALLCGVPIDACRAGLAAYGGIPHRLERVGEARGVAFFNDSKATNVDAAVTALRSFDRGVHLVAGGRGKGTPYAPLVEAARGRVDAVYTIGEDAPAIAAAFAGSGIPVVPCEALEAACRDAFARADHGDVVVLSPACASFDQFRDYGHRGEVFRSVFRAIEAELALEGTAGDVVVEHDDGTKGGRR
jgi:UDP-N-acetylmuramoylalanine--D-glutamate ligase